MNTSLNDGVNDVLPTSGNVSDTAKHPWCADAVAAVSKLGATSAPAADKPTVNPGLLVFLGCAAVLVCGFLAAAMAANSSAAYMDYDAFLMVEGQILVGILTFLWNLITGIFGFILSMFGL